MANEILRASTVSYATDSAFTTPVPMGTLADEGTDVGDPEVQTETVGGGKPLAVAATLGVPLRVLGDGGSWLATLQGYVLDGTEIYLRIYGANGTDYTQVGPVTVTKAHPKGRTTDPKRQSVLCMFGAAGETPDQFLSNG